MDTMSKMERAPTARQRARAEITNEILVAARTRLTKQGPGELSLRAVARDVGMVSSAVYRYFASRDELLTALLVLAYNELGEAAEVADAAIEDRGAYLARWMAACATIRSWALDHPGDYALLYGSPVPDYVAPEDTIDAAVRPTLVLVSIVDEAHGNGSTLGPALPPGPDDPGQEDVADIIGDALSVLRERSAHLGSAPEVTLRLIVAWSALFGAISFELFGHLVGSVNDNDAYFEHVVRGLAVDLDLA